MRGVFEFDYEGKRRGFYFNFNALGILEEHMNAPIDDLIQQLTDGAGKGKPKVKILLNFFHAGAVNYCEAKKIEQDFSIHDVGDWISEIGIDQAGKLLMQALSTTTPKNSSPLQTAEGSQSAGE
jgi:hypothetical protein